VNQTTGDKLWKWTEKWEGKLLRWTESWERSFQNWQTVKAYPHASWLTKRFFVHATTFPNGLKKKRQGRKFPWSRLLRPWGQQYGIYFQSTQPPRYNWNIVESGVKHHDPYPSNQQHNTVYLLFYHLPEPRILWPSLLYTIFLRQGFCDQVCSRIT
jgi:hypothetical protein